VSKTAYQKCEILAVFSRIQEGPLDLNQQSYRRLISGQSRGFVAGLLRACLRVLSWFYLIVIMLRNLLYSKGWVKAHKANAVVISVGNITTGGTGKTPLVIWLCNLLQDKGVRCAILTRGYKLKKSRLYDEPAILTKSCPDAKVVVNRDRVAGASQAINKFDAEALVMDDGFQHRRLNRDLDIVTIDAMRPFGYEKLLPAGLLREPVVGLKRADAVVITRCDQIDAAELAALQQKIRAADANIVIAHAVHAPVCVKSVEHKQITIEQIKQRNVFAFCGIGNPDAFWGTLSKLGLNLVGSRVYNDHYHYTEDSLTDICEEARYLGANIILTTEKDWTKTGLLMPTDDIVLAYLVVGLEFLTGEDQIRDLIENALAGRFEDK
jgi:tetraacyldisaccharide 4'-kinase